VQEWVGSVAGAPPIRICAPLSPPHRTGQGAPLSADQLASHITFVAFAAYETMSSALTWVLFFSPFHP
jgi:hypothetical protein